VVPIASQASRNDDTARCSSNRFSKSEDPKMFRGCFQNLDYVHLIMHIIYELFFEAISMEH